MLALIATLFYVAGFVCAGHAVLTVRTAQGAIAWSVSLAGIADAQDYVLFQLNFRNHRKIVVVDGRLSWVGGHNVGDEYLGRDPEFSPWRDTHLRIDGPAAIQL